MRASGHGFLVPSRAGDLNSDAGIALPEDGPSVHSRFYGSYPRKIRRYAIERKVLSVENAIRASTSLPAQILRVQERGGEVQRPLTPQRQFVPNQRDGARAGAHWPSTDKNHYQWYRFQSVQFAGTVVQTGPKE